MKWAAPERHTLLPAERPLDSVPLGPCDLPPFAGAYRREVIPMLANLYPLVKPRAGADAMSWVALAVTALVLAVIAIMTVVAAIGIRRDQASATPVAPMTQPSGAKAA
jgi:hypothetical protein